MSKEELIARLHEISVRQPSKDRDEEQGHMDADDALIEYIDDPEIKAAYESVRKWYA